jgi:NDP-sugar pyrophosphorylase family protein
MMTTTLATNATTTLPAFLTLEGELPQGLTLQPYEGKGGQFGLLHSQATGLSYLLFPGSQAVLPNGATVALPGNTLLSNEQLTPLASTPPPVPQTLCTQAMILGAGLGTRIMPLTEQFTGFAKPSLPFVGEESVIGLLVKRLAAFGIQRLFVNTYFQPHSVRAALDAAVAQCPSPMQWFEVCEARPTGTAGGLLEILNHPEAFPAFNPNEPLLMLQGDAVTTADFNAMAAAHQAQASQRPSITLGSQRVSDEDVSKFGIMATNAQGRITHFLEKPSLAEAGPHRLGSTGFYMMDAGIFPVLQAWYQQRLQQERTATNQPTLERCQEFDFAKDVFAGCLAEDYPLHAFEVSAFWCDIGNPTQYLHTLQQAYAGALPGLPLPADTTPYYSPEGVFYWPKAYAPAQQEGLRLSGGVVVMPHQPLP